MQCIITHQFSNFQFNVEWCTSKHFFFERTGGTSGAAILDGARTSGFELFLIGGKLLGGALAGLASTEPCFGACFGLLGIGVAPALLAAARAATASNSSLDMATSNYCSTT